MFLCDYATTSESLQGVAQDALSQLNTGDTQRCLSISGHKVYVSRSHKVKKLVYLIVTDGAFLPGPAFQLLDDIEKAFKHAKLDEKASNARPYSLRVEFGDQLQAQVDRVNGNNTGHLKKKVANVQEKVKVNIDKMAERGDKLVDLVDRSERLSLNSVEFHRTAKRLRLKHMWRSCRLWAILISILLFIIAIVIVLIVLGVTKKI